MQFPLKWSNGLGVSEVTSMDLTSRLFEREPASISACVARTSLSIYRSKNPSRRHSALAMGRSSILGCSLAFTLTMHSELRLNACWLVDELSFRLPVLNPCLAFMLLRRLLGMPLGLLLQFT